MSMKQLTLTADQKKSRFDPITNRRNKLIDNINKQIVFVECEIEGEEFEGRKPMKWFWVGDDNKYRCSIFYGKKAIEIEKGKFSFLSPSLDEMKDTLQMVRECVKQGDLDGKIEFISKQMRKNFNR